MNNTEKDTTAENKQDAEQLEETRDSAQTDGKDEKQEIVYIDDHHTVADMNVEGLPWFVKSGHDKKKKEGQDKLSFKEKFALVFGAYRAYFPILLGIGVGFLAVFLLLKWLWG